MILVIILAPVVVGAEPSGKGHGITWTTHSGALRKRPFLRASVVQEGLPR